MEDGGDIDFEPPKGDIQLRIPTLDDNDDS